jgi:hypothetical protein
MTTIHDIPPELAPHWFRNTAEFWLARHGEREPSPPPDPSQEWDLTPSEAETFRRMSEAGSDFGKLKLLAPELMDAADLAEAKRRLADEGDKAVPFKRSK